MEQTNEELLEENKSLRERVSSLEDIIKSLQHRLTDTLADWRDACNRLRSHEISDILCDFIAEFYHNELMTHIKSEYDKNKLVGVLDQPPSTWNEISIKLSATPTLKQACMSAANLTEDEWDALYAFKRSRNVRVHPRHNTKVVQRVVREIPNGVLRTALAKLLSNG